MKPRTPALRWMLFCLALMANAHPELAHGSLGASADSIESDRLALQAERGVEQDHGSFKTTEMKAGEVSVRQFVDSGSQVFAVVWNGEKDDSQSPTIDVLLGKYAAMFRSYQADHPRKNPRAAYRKVTVGPVVMEFWNTVKVRKARAYLAGRIPDGLDIDQIN